MGQSQDVLQNPYSDNRQSTAADNQGQPGSDGSDGNSTNGDASHKLHLHGLFGQVKQGATKLRNSAVGRKTEEVAKSVAQDAAQEGKELGGTANRTVHGQATEQDKRNLVSVGQAVLFPHLTVARIVIGEAAKQSGVAARVMPNNSEVASTQGAVPWAGGGREVNPGISTILSLGKGRFGAASMIADVVVKQGRREAVVNYAPAQAGNAPTQAGQYAPRGYGQTQREFAQTQQPSYGALVPGYASTSSAYSSMSPGYGAPRESVVPHVIAAAATTIAVNAFLPHRSGFVSAAFIPRGDVVVPNRAAAPMPAPVREVSVTVQPVPGIVIHSSLGDLLR